MLVSLIHGVFSEWVPGGACLVGVETYFPWMGDGLLEEGICPKESGSEELVLNRFTWQARGYQQRQVPIGSQG